MGKKIIKGDDAYKALLDGIEAVATTVATTLGPAGKTVFITRDEKVPHITKDGVTVANSIIFSDPALNAGAQFIKDVAGKTVKEAGDGTTSSTIIAAELCKLAYKAINKKEETPQSIIRKLKSVRYDLIEKLKHLSQTDIDRDVINSVALMSTNGDKIISKLVVDAFINKDNITIDKTANVIVTIGKELEDELIVQDGYMLDRGYINPLLINQKGTSECVLNNPVVLLTNRAINDISTITAFITKGNTTKRDMFIICADCKDNVINDLHRLGILEENNIGIVKSPNFGEARNSLLKDLGIILNTEPITTTTLNKLENPNFNLLGTCEKVVITKEKTNILGYSPRREKLDEHIRSIESEIKQLENSPLKQEFCRERITALTTKTRIIKIGGWNESEALERKDRADDAVCAIKSTFEQGYVIGGGMTYFQLAKELSPSNNIISNALRSIFYTLCENAGLDINKTFQQIEKQNNVYDFRTNTACDAKESGIIDPTKVVVNCIQNAIQVAIMFLNTSAIIIDDKQEK